MTTGLALVMVSSIVGNFLAAAIAGKVGYRPAVVVMCLAYFVTMFFAYHVPRDHENLLGWLLAVGICQGVFALFTMYLPPLFPTLLRTTGAGFSYNIGRLAAAFGTVYFGTFSKAGVCAAPSARCRRCGSSRARRACRCGRWLRILCVRRSGLWRRLLVFGAVAGCRRAWGSRRLLRRLRPTDCHVTFGANSSGRMPIITRLLRWMRSKLAAIATRTPWRNGPFGGPVAAGAAAVFGAGEDDRRRAFGFVFHGGVVDRHDFAVGQVAGDAAFGAGGEQVADADVGERAAGHHAVVAAAGAVAVEVARLDAVRDQVLAGGAVFGDRAGGRDVVGRDRVAEGARHARRGSAGSAPARARGRRRTAAPGCRCCRGPSRRARLRWF